MASSETTWLCTHAAVTAAAQDPVTFSSRTSRHLQIPNGMDGDEHATWRAFIDQWFTPERVEALAPQLGHVARELVADLLGDADDAPGRAFDAVGDLGRPFAVRATCAWLGWPTELEGELLAWMATHDAATRSGEHARTAAAAAEYDTIIRRLTELRRGAGEEAPDDVTTELVRARVDGRALEDEEIVAVLRNWTAGDLSSVALCVGVLLRSLADSPAVQRDIRSRLDDPAALDRAIDELLRIDDPFVSNRRLVTRDVEVDGVELHEGERAVLRWVDANRDPQHFTDPEHYDPEGHARDNLVYGTGPHVCPGRGLSTLELRVVLTEVLTATAWLEPGAGGVRQESPLGGWAVAPVVATLP